MVLVKRAKLAYKVRNFAQFIYKKLVHFGPSHFLFSSIWPGPIFWGKKLAKAGKKTAQSTARLSPDLIFGYSPMGSIPYILKILSSYNLNGLLISSMGPYNPNAPYNLCVAL